MFTEHLGTCKQPRLSSVTASGAWWKCFLCSCNKYKLFDHWYKHSKWTTLSSLPV